MSMLNLNKFKNVVLDNVDIRFSNSRIEKLIQKMKTVLDNDDIEILNDLGSRLENVVVEESFVDRYEEITSDDLNEVFKKYIWEDSESWADEMSSVSSGILSKLNMLESDAFKQLIIQLNKKES